MQNTPSHLLVDHTFSGNSARFLLHIDEDARGPSALRALFASQNCVVLTGFMSPCRFISVKSYQPVDTEQRMSWLSTCASETFLSLKPVTCCLCPPPQMSQGLCKRWNVQRGIKTSYSWRRGWFGNVLFFVSAAQAFPWCCPLFFPGVFAQAGFPFGHPRLPALAAQLRAPWAPACWGTEMTGYSFWRDENYVRSKAHSFFGHQWWRSISFLFLRVCLRQARSELWLFSG